MNKKKQGQHIWRNCGDEKAHMCKDDKGEECQVDLGWNVRDDENLIMTMSQNEMGLNIATEGKATDIQAEDC